MNVPGVVFQPETYQGMQRGINQLVEAIRPTLGPLPRLVALDRLVDHKAPELLDNGGIIARRILALPDRRADMGAMYLRQLLWRIHEQVGDGTATTAVLFQAIFNEGVRYVVAGGSPMMLRRHLEAGQGLILAELNRLTTPLQGQDNLARLAASVCYSPALARMLGDSFDHMGQDGRLEIRSGHSGAMKREYVAGSYWDSKRFSNPTQADPSVNTRAELLDAAILISDLDLADPQELDTLLAVAGKAGLYNLVIVANRLSEAIVGILYQVNQTSNKFKVIATRTPGTSTVDQAAFMDDLAVLTGGCPCLKVIGDTLSGVTPDDFGTTRRVWADRDYLGLVGGQGDARQIRSRLQTLRRTLDRTTEPVQRRQLQLRIGQLLGGTAVVWVGGATETELETRKALAERTVNALRGAMRDGVVPGGGAALLACRAVIRPRLEQATCADERAAWRILHLALEAPLRALVANAGYEAGGIIGKLSYQGLGCGFDVIAGEVVDMVEAGIWDSAAVVKAAVGGAISAAALALTTDVLIHHKSPPQATEP
ncbi:MAG TPA: TCP-1/cpn60 chaperonin family protein [Anaerolineae bacterium]|jgi:chaperonin GroEL